MKNAQTFDPQNNENLNLYIQQRFPQSSYNSYSLLHAHLFVHSDQAKGLILRENHQCEVGTDEDDHSNCYRERHYLDSHSEDNKSPDEQDSEYNNIHYLLNNEWDEETTAIILNTMNQHGWSDYHQDTQSEKHIQKDGHSFDVAYQRFQDGWSLFLVDVNIFVVVIIGWLWERLRDAVCRVCTQVQEDEHHYATSQGNAVNYSTDQVQDTDDLGADLQVQAQTTATEDGHRGTFSCSWQIQRNTKKS